jgi:FixJ family two-component response regulator
MYDTVPRCVLSSAVAMRGLHYLGVRASGRRRRTFTLKDPVISIIDDDAATRCALAALMNAKGLKAKIYESAEAFLQADASQSCQCIITDVYMPGLSGIELKQRLNASHCQVPVIMITGRIEQRLHDLALQSGAFCLLRKPFKTQLLFACLERALAR